MRLKTKAIIASCLVVLILIGVVFAFVSSDTQKIEESLNMNNVLGSSSTANDINKTEYTKALENNNLEFWVNEDTTEFKVVNKTNGSEWYSSNPNRSSGTLESAPIQLTYLNSKGALAEMNVITDSVADGKYSIERSENKVTVRYSIGEFSELSLVPYALTEKRFNEIIGALDDEFEQMKLVDLYYLTDINIIEDKELKKKRLSDYPKLADEKLYIIRDATRDDPIAQKDIAKIFALAGYTEADYKADSKYFKANTDVRKAPGFNLAVEYSLDGRKLHVSIPHDSIEMDEGFPLTAIKVAPYFGSPVQGEKGWFLLPDGSGSIMNFYNGNVGGKVYRTTVYGEDITMLGKENLNSDLGASLPVFGMKRSDGGVLCEITEGSAISEIAAYTGDSSDAAYAHAVFNVRSTYKTAAATGRKETYVIIQKARYSGDIALDYNFLESSDASLTDMASIVRTEIFSDSKNKVSNNLPVILNLVGLITRRNQFLGIGYNEKIELTDFEQSSQIADSFLDGGINDLSIVLTGWFGEGVDHGFLSKRVSPSSRLGGKKAFTSLIKSADKNNIPLYLDGDIQYTANTSLFDGFSKSDTATMLDQGTGRLHEYNLASFIRKSGGTTYINNSAASSKALATLKTSADAYGLKGLSLRNVGAHLYSDYGNPTVDRQAMADAMTEELSALAKAGYDITTQGANAYVLPFITKAENVPVTSSCSDATNTSVPFLQMVLSGKIDYYAPAINLSGDTQTAFLNAVSVGAGISCTLTAQDGDKVVGSNQNILYSTDASYWKNSLVDMIADAQKRLAPVAGKRIIDYKELDVGVYKTVYENGAEVIVNHNSNPFVYGNITVDAKNFNLKGVN